MRNVVILMTLPFGVPFFGAARTRTYQMQMSGGLLLAAVSGGKTIRGGAEAIESGCCVNEEHPSGYPFLVPATKARIHSMRMCVKE